MKKMQALYDYLLGTGLVTADQLHVIVTEGHVTFSNCGDASPNVTFSRNYTAQVLVSNYGGDVDKLDAAIVWWCGLFQPDLSGDQNGYGFEADIQSKETADICALVRLTETVRWDNNSQSMTNCLQAYVIDDATPLNLPLFFMDMNEVNQHD